MKKYLSSFSLLFALFFTQCTKDGSVQDQLPPITTSGANTFGCKVNGSVWLPHGDFSFLGLFADYSIDRNNKKYYLNIEAVNTKGQKSRLSLKIENLIDTGLYKYNPINYSPIYFDNGTLSYYVKDESQFFKVTKFDTASNIISGVFSFNCYPDTSHHSNTVIHVTEGRFDFHYPVREP